MKLTDIIEQLKNINENSTVTITSTKEEEQFTLEQINENEYKLYISENVSTIEWLFLKNKKVKKIIFDNWNTHNIKNMDFAFSEIELDEMPDFSQLDLSNLELANGMFYKTVVNNDFVFKNHTLNKLEYTSGMFGQVKCNNLIVDLDKTLITSGGYMFTKVECHILKVTIKETAWVDFSGLLSEAKIHTIDLQDLNLSNCDMPADYLDLVETEKIIMPE